MFLHPFFKGFSKKNIVFRFVALVIKKLWAILDFFFAHSRLFTALYPTLCVVIVSQMRVLGQNNYRGGAERPPPSLYRVNEGRSFLIVKDRIRSFTTVTNDPSMTTITDDLSLMIVNNDPFLIDKIHFWSENIEEISLN